MTPDRAAELAKTIKTASQIIPERARCSRCLRMFETGEIHEGLCEPCTQASKEEVSQGKLRELVFVRDRGLCAECHVDTLALREELDNLRSVGGLENMRRFSARLHFFVRLGFNKKALEGGETLWEAAHIKARVEGGENDPSNVLTMCIRCHAKDTKALASRRADARKPRKRFGR